MDWLIPIIIISDQLSKLWAQNILTTQPFSVWFIQMTYAENTGIAFGMLKNNTFFHGITAAIIVTGMLIYKDIYLRKNKDFSGLLNMAVSMIAGGALGNIFDRIRIGYVVDMFYVPNFAIFNVADSFVCIGAFFIFIYFILVNMKKKKETF